MQAFKNSNELEFQFREYLLCRFYYEIKVAGLDLYEFIHSRYYARNEFYYQTNKGSQFGNWTLSAVRSKLRSANWNENSVPLSYYLYSLHIKLIINWSKSAQIQTVSCSNCLTIEVICYPSIGTVSSMFIFFCTFSKNNFWNSFQCIRGSQMTVDQINF